MSHCRVQNGPTRLISVDSVRKLAASVRVLFHQSLTEKMEEEEGIKGLLKKKKLPVFLGHSIKCKSHLKAFYSVS